ncbi:MAG: SIS domain-containing protein [Kordiimonadaceae bacterium]|nr:SIS domain-containing protein [Kordiimonadaceae bacterium]MBO6569767.1 SIS domain-containing protein [Kordiimonadaceae bacterium]MBO6966302.1 SIS domain-containing protein [Kordiimonadaceae bacterium]
MSDLASQTQMHKEALEAPERVAEFLAARRDNLMPVVQAIRDFGPRFVVTCARGSSDHSATYAKYLVEKKLGLPVVSHAPSMSSVFEQPLNFDGALFVAISQSGGSPDLIKSAEMAGAGGAMTIAFVNATGSKLAEVCDHVVPLMAGPETSIAATKSYIASLTAVASLVAELAEDLALKEALLHLPAHLKQAAGLDWSAAKQALIDASNFYVVARGLGLGIAQETALKFKETSGLHAEAFSAAEVRHGPMALVKHGFPILMYAPSNAASLSFLEAAEQAVEAGASVLSVGADIKGAKAVLPTVDDVHPALAPITMIQSFYPMVNALSIERGYDPDKPPQLRKVTETL